MNFTVRQLNGGDESLSLSETELAFSSVEGADSIDVTSNANWSWSSNVSWLTATTEAEEQNGNQAFSFELAANDGGSAREGNITFRSETGRLVETLTIVQGARVSLSESELVTDFSAKEDLSFDVLADTTWVWESNAVWLTSGLGATQGTLDTTTTTSFIYDIAENTGNESPRIGTITFRSSDGNTTVNFTVRQLNGGDESLSLSETELAFSSVEGADSIDVTSNANWSWSSNVSWLTATTEAEEQNGNQAFSFELAANDGGSAREGNITFRSETGRLVETLTIVQGARVSLSESELVTDFSAKEDLSFDVLADTTWVWESNAVWLTSGLGATQGTLDTTTTTSFIYDIAENTGNESPRIGTITFRSSDGNTTVNFTVRQLSGTDETLVISETPLFSDFTAKSLTVDVTSNTDWLWSSNEAWLSSAEDQAKNGDFAGFEYNMALNDTGAERTGTITFRTASGRLVQTLTVTQLGNSGDFLILSDSIQASDFTAKSDLSVDVFSSLDVIWESDQEWLTSGAASTLTATPDGQAFIYEVNENTTGQTREGFITFTTVSGDLIKSLLVIQGGDTGDYLIASETLVTTDFNGKTINSVNVFSGTEWTWEVSADDREWLSSSNPNLTQAGDAEPFPIVVAENTTDGIREGTITFSSTTGNLEHVLTVRQLSGSNTFLNLSEAEATYSAESTVRSVDVTSNTEWTWRSTAGWLRASVTPTLTGDGSPFTFEYSVDANTGEAPREARLQFFSTDGRLTAELVVTQLANSGSVLSLSETAHANSFEATPDCQPKANPSVFQSYLVMGG